MCLGVQELPRRREKEGGAGYSRRGVLPPSMYSRTASNMRPGTPHHRRRPAALSLPEGTTPLVASSCSPCRRRKYGSQIGLSGTYRGPSLAARDRDERMHAISARRAAPVGTGGTGTPPALILHAPGTRMSVGTE